MAKQIFGLFEVNTFSWLTIARLFRTFVIAESKVPLHAPNAKLAATEGVIVNE